LSEERVVELETGLHDGAIFAEIKAFAARADEA
jgi:hypothetical protein